MKPFFITVFFTAAALTAQNAEEIVDRADNIYDYETAYTRSMMTIVRNGRAQPVQELEGYSRDVGEDTYSLSITRSPARLRGNATLSMGDDIWTRFASTGRVRRLSSSAKKGSSGGSDFAYIDGAGAEGYLAKYTAFLNGSETINGRSCYRITLTPQSGAEGVYEKLIVFIDQADYRYHRIEYYEDGAFIKEQMNEDWRSVEGFQIAFRVTMTNHTRDSVSTSVLREVVPNSDRVKANMFSTRYLESLR